MKTLHTYLFRQVLTSLLLTVAVFTFVLLLGNVLKEVLTILINRQASLGLVTRAIGLLIPFVWVFALPMGMLTATLLIFGRFSADQELTAVRASGVSLISVISPILLLSLVLCGISAEVNMDIGPRCRVAYKRLFETLAVQLSSAHLPEGRFITDYPGTIVYVGRNRKGELQDIMVFRSKDGPNPQMTLRAARGRMELDTTNRVLTLFLYDTKSTLVRDGRTVPGPALDMTVELPLNPNQRGSQSPRIDDMTFVQLLEELRYLEHTVNAQSSLEGASKQDLLVRKYELGRVRWDLTAPVRFQIHRQVAFSFACFGFTLIGIPLGIRVHRRETNIGIGIALLLVAVYYSFVMVAQALEHRPELAPHLIVWLPNLVFQAVGAVLLWRANRGV